MNLKQLLQSTPEIQDLLSTQQWEAVANFLNAQPPAIPNPVAIAQVQKIPTINEVSLAIVTDEEIVDIYRMGIKPDVDDAIQNNPQNIPDILRAASTVLSPQSLLNLQTLLSQTIDDPNYQSMIPDPLGSIAQQNGLGIVTSGDVAIAYHS